MLFPEGPPTKGQLLAIGAAASVAYILALSIYRLYFSPVAKFPGPKLAALTFWYEFYYDVIKRGRYTWKIKELHEKYGAFALASINRPFSLLGLLPIVTGFGIWYNQFMIN